MTYEEYEKAVYEECKKDGAAQSYPDDFEKAFEESKGSGDIKWHYDNGYSIADTAWGICLLI